MLNGLGDNDILRGGDGNDTLNGGDDNDRLSGEAGNDSLFGGAGDDGLTGGAGNDLIDGGAGFDSAMFAGRREDYTIVSSAPTDPGSGPIVVSVSGPDGNDTLVNVERLFFDNVTVNLLIGDDAVDDVLTGDYSVETITDQFLNTVTENRPSDDIIYCFGGDDTVYGLLGDDTIYGGDGDDTLIGGAGNDKLFGGAGTDTAVYSGNQADYLVTALANGVIEVSDQRAGSPDGTDRLESIENLKFADVVTNFVMQVATANMDRFFGFGSNDTVSYANAPGGVVASLLRASKNTGWAAGDTYDSIENLTGSDFNDALTGDAGDNILEGGLGADRLNGGPGSDTASYAHAAVGVTADLTRPSNNTGEAAGDTYNSIENLLGSAHDDQLVGNKAANVLNGQDGNDSLTGNRGFDTLSGGLGNDVFNFLTTRDGADTITDFVVNVDKIGIARSGFKIAATVDVGAGGSNDFAAHYFVANPTGMASEIGHGQFVFNQTTENLFWDADGAGARAGLLVAHFTNGAQLLGTDFLLH